MHVNRIQPHTDRDVRTNTSHSEPFSDAGNEQLNNISHESLKAYSKRMKSSQYINPASRPEDGTIAAFNSPVRKVMAIICAYAKFLSCRRGGGSREGSVAT